LQRKVRVRILIISAAFTLVFSTAIVLVVYRVARLPLWVALLFPLLIYVVGGLLNVIGTLLGRHRERSRQADLPQQFSGRD
jgi:uncharacterized membrane protein YagU involved in acid resistance